MSGSRAWASLPKAPTPAPEKAAPIPAEDAVNTVAGILALNYGREYVTGRDLEVAEEIVAALAGGQEERIREDEKGLRGKFVYPCARFRNDNEFRDPEGYVIVKAERAAASEGRPGPKYYTLVSDTGEVRTLLSTLFTRDLDRARQRGDAS